MKKLLLSAVVLSSTANAQVIIECPKYLPSKEVALPEAHVTHEGGARLFPSRLSSAGIQVSELYGQPVEVPPPGRKLKDGWETEYRFTPEETKWLVCRYGGDGTGFKGGAITENVEWWGKLSQSATYCLLRVKENKQPHSASSWTATAICETSKVGR